MQINNNKLIVECTHYDFKEALERKKTKSWLKSISAFSNGGGGSLFYGIADDGTIVGLADAQSDAEFISEAIKAKIDPVPEFILIPHVIPDGKVVLEVNVKDGHQTPYYYYLDGARTAFVRVGNESVTATSQQLLSLVLKGSNSTYDSLPTKVKRDEHSFIMLANIYKERTGQAFEEKLLESFGLVKPDGYLTNAGLLFTDNCPVYQSRIFCTRWDGLVKDNAIHDAEYKGNLIMLLRDGIDFIKTFTNKGWKKMPSYRLNLPDYAERATFEALVNHLIHRDYTVIGGEVHLDIYDDKLILSSPGGMYDGTLIQERNITQVPSLRRNPVIADVFAQLDYMEKRGSGLRKICEISATLPNYKEDKKPSFISEGTQFMTIFKNVNYGMETSLEVYHKYTESIPKNIPKAQWEIIRLMSVNSRITVLEIMDELSLSRPTVMNNIKKLKEQGFLERIGANKGGYWKILK